jgi:hypothetical protein
MEDECVGPIFEVGIQLMKATIPFKYFIIHYRFFKLSSQTLLLVDFTF